MTEKTQPTAPAEITAPFSADLRRLPALSEQDAGLLEQAASMLEGLHNDERNRGNCSAAEGAACSADAVRRLAVQLLRSTETAQCLHQGAEPDKHMTIGRALREGLRAEPWISSGPGAAACVGLCAIQLQGWWHTAETAKAYADAYNRGTDDMRAALQAAPPAPAAVPVLYVSPEQLAKHRDLEGAENAEAGRYLPARKTPAGKFTQPLYALAAAPASASDTESVLIDGIAYEVPAAVAEELLSLHLDLLAAAPAQAVAVPADSSARNGDGRHPKDDEPRTDACIAALNARGDDRGQGLDGYWKWGFAAGFNAAMASPAQENATQLAGQGQEDCAVLDGDWRRRMLDGSAIARDEMGCGEHPALPVLEEGMKPAQFFDALGIELVGIMAENQMDGDAYDAMVEDTDYNVWKPEAPAGEGWSLVAIFDTEDGPAAWWMRESAPEQPARKNRKAAPAPAQEDAREGTLRFDLGPDDWFKVDTGPYPLYHCLDCEAYDYGPTRVTHKAGCRVDAAIAARAAQGGAA